MSTLNCNLGLNLFDEPFSAENYLNCGFVYYCTYGEGNCVEDEEGFTAGGDQYYEEGTSYVGWLDGYTNTCGGVVNSGANASFLLPLSRLEDMGIVVESNIRCFVVYEGNIVSTGSQYRPDYGAAVSCAIWGDEPVTPEVEIMPDNAPIEFYFINGLNVYKVTNLTNVFGNIRPSNWSDDAIFTIFPNVTQIELYCTLSINDFVVPQVEEVVQVVEQEVQEVEQISVELEEVEVQIEETVVQVEETVVPEEVIVEQPSVVAELEQLIEEEEEIIQEATETLVVIQENISQVETETPEVEEEIINTNASIQTVIDAFNSEPVVVVREAEQDVEKEGFNKNLLLIGGALLLTFLVIRR